LSQLVVWRCFLFFGKGISSEDDAADVRAGRSRRNADQDAAAKLAASKEQKQEQEQEEQEKERGIAGTSNRQTDRSQKTVAPPGA
jgi:hypothetical protein